MAGRVRAGPGGEDHRVTKTTTHPPVRLAPEALALPLTGARMGETGTLGGLLQEPALLVFLRHGG